MYPVPSRLRSTLLLGAAALLACGAGEPGSPPAASEGLVFTRLVGDSTDLVRARIADGAERAVTSTPERNERWPRWSDAAGALLFQAAPRAGGPNDLYLWDPQTGAETPLVVTPDRDERWQRWSPGGDRVVYAFQGGDAAAGVALLRPSDGAIRILASSRAKDFFLRPHFSPDAARLVVQRRGPDGSGSWLWILEEDREPRRVTWGPGRVDLKAWFTRDGSQIVFSRRPRGLNQHRVVRIDGSGENQRVLAGSDGRDSHSAQPSPTRDEIVFVAAGARGYDVFLADLDGAGARALTQTPERNEMAPHWSPDGERLVVTTTPADVGVPGLSPQDLARSSIRVLDRQGQELFHAPGFMADWMPPWP